MVLVNLGMSTSTDVGPSSKPTASTSGQAEVGTLMWGAQATTLLKLSPPPKTGEPSKIWGFAYLLERPSSDYCSPQRALHGTLPQLWEFADLLWIVDDIQK